MAGMLTLHRMELPRSTTAHSDISHQARLDNIVKSLHGLLDRGVRVKSVALQDVDVVQAETLKRFLHSSKDVLAIQPTTVDQAGDSTPIRACPRRGHGTYPYSSGFLVLQTIAPVSGYSGPA